jgi:hypothetical protein
MRTRILYVTAIQQYKGGEGLKVILQKVGVCFVVLILFDAFAFPLSEARAARIRDFV